MRRILLDALVQAVEDGHTGERAMVKGTADALAIRYGAGARGQVEEHYLRGSSERRAAEVRTRIEEGASQSDFETMARQICKLRRHQPSRTGTTIWSEGVLIR